MTNLAQFFYFFILLQFESMCQITSLHLVLLSKHFRHLFLFLNSQKTWLQKSATVNEGRKFCTVRQRNVFQLFEIVLYLTLGGRLAVFSFSASSSSSCLSNTSASFSYHNIGHRLIYIQASHL